MLCAQMCLLVGMLVRMCSPGKEIIEILREEVGSVTVTSTPKRAAWAFTARDAAVY